MADEQKVRFNDVEFVPHPEAPYRYDYEAIFRHLKSKKDDQQGAFRQLCQNDSFFLVFFVLKVPVANCPFWVKACREVDEGPSTNTLDLWAREHGKSTIITIAGTIKAILKNKEERIGIFSHTKNAALRFLRVIKFVFEQNIFLKLCFPDILYMEPEREAWKWSEDAGLYVRRDSQQKEPTLTAAGLVEGMPTGDHFSGRIYDDIETMDLVNSPDVIDRLKESFDMSQNLGTADGWHKVTGTYYHHEGLLKYIEGKCDADGNRIYTTRIKPATVDGTPNGVSAYLPEKRLAELRTNRKMFYAQQLLDPTPQGGRKLDSSKLEEISVNDIPKQLYKFFLVDPAGERTTREKRQDSWGLAVVGVNPFISDVGASDLYILDMVIEPLTESEAMNTIIRMYTRNGRIEKLCVEKVGMISAEVHIANALRAKGIFVSLENGRLYLLRPAGRSKQQRIESNLSWPLDNGKIRISKGVPACYRERLRLELDKFPFWHDDGLDTLSYTYDVLRDYRFNLRPIEDTRPKRPKIDWGDKEENRFKWMSI